MWNVDTVAVVQNRKRLGIEEVAAEAVLEVTFERGWARSDNHVAIIRRTI